MKLGRKIGIVVAVIVVVAIAVRAILENAEIFRLEEPSSGVLQKAWEAIVDAVGEILEAKDEQVATQIPFAGEIENPDAGLLAPSSTCCATLSWPRSRIRSKER